MNTAYDKYTYLSDPSPASHPDRLFTVARLLGMNPLPERPGTSRILEIGCGSGPSTIPMAASLPEAEIVAVDVSQNQIDRLLARADRLQLSNISVRRLDLREFQDDDGTFDYVIAHGLYSWVPPDAREALLAICGQYLAPAGIAFLSYNVNPGWHLRQPARQFLQFHLRNETDPEIVVRRSQEILPALIDAFPNPFRTYRELFNSLRESILNPERGGSYVIHDLLGEALHPVSFTDFTRHAASYGLKFLGEADFEDARAMKLGPELQRLIADWTSDPLAVEQYIDLLSARPFRKSLLCRAGVSSEPHVSAERLRNVHVAGMLDCQHPKRQLTTSEPLDFTGGADALKGSTRHPLTKAVVLALCEAWPQPVWLDDLLDQAATRLGGPDVQAQYASPADRHEVMTSLTRLLSSGILRAYSDCPPFQVHVSASPVASPVARLQAEEGSKIANRLQHPVDADDFQRTLLPLLDGTRSREQLLDDWTTIVLQHDLRIADVPASAVAVAQVRTTLTRRLDDDLEVMARAALLVG